MVACTQDPDVATRLMRLGNAPVSFVGPNLLLVMLGVSGQLERHRWITRIAGIFALVMTGLCWGRRGSCRRSTAVGRPIRR